MEKKPGPVAEVVQTVLVVVDSSEDGEMALGGRALAAKSRASVYVVVQTELVVVVSLEAEVELLEAGAMASATMLQSYGER